MTKTPKSAEGDNALRRVISEFLDALPTHGGLHSDKITDLIRRVERAGYAFHDRRAGRVLNRVEEELHSRVGTGT